MMIIIISFDIFHQYILNYHLSLIMHFEISFRWKSQTIKINMPKISSVQDLIELLKMVFKIQDQIIGVTDSYGKFYDIQFVAKNIATLNQKTISLVTAQAINQENGENLDNISFATNKQNQNVQSQFDFNDFIQQRPVQLPSIQPEGLLGTIDDLELFEGLILNQQFTIVVCAKKFLNQQIQHACYYLKSEQNKILIYNKRKRICEIPFQNLELMAKIIDIYAQNSTTETIAKQFVKKQRRNMKEPELFNLFKQNRQNINKKQENHHEHHHEHHHRHQIPIIVRKNNNSIQKVNTSSPLTQQQLQASNSLLELEIQGLINEEQMKKIKFMIMSQNPQALNLFQKYMREQISSLALCKKLMRCLGTCMRNQD